MFNTTKIKHLKHTKENIEKRFGLTQNIPYLVVVKKLRFKKYK